MSYLKYRARKPHGHIPAVWRTAHGSVGRSDLLLVQERGPTVSLTTRSRARARGAEAPWQPKGRPRPGATIRGRPQVSLGVGGRRADIARPRSSPPFPSTLRRRFFDPI